MSEKVSVIMATYNGQEFLAEQLDSIIGQSYQNLEIIIQDDGSTDGTLEIINGYLRKDERIRFHCNEQNLGIIPNFLSLISKATGEFIAVSDQDDIWDLTKIEKLVANIGSSSLIYTDSILIDQTGSPVGITLLEKLDLQPESGKFLTSLLGANTISGHAFMFNKSLCPIIQRWDNNSIPEGMMYDLFIGLSASLYGGVRFHSEPLTFHRVHAHNNHNHLHNKLNAAEEQKAPNGRKTNIKRLPFRPRKKHRIGKKLRHARDQIQNLERAFDICADDDHNPFKQHQNCMKKFNWCFRNSKLYSTLIRLGCDKKRARKLTRGRLYYAFFKII